MTAFSYIPLKDAVIEAATDIRQPKYIVYLFLFSGNILRGNKQLFVLRVCRLIYFKLPTDNHS